MAEALQILILEDNPNDAALVQFELEDAGFVFTPKVVMTEEDFVRGIQEFCPDLILSDYDLPTYNGAFALAEARKRCPDTPFILVTGAVSEDRAVEILTQGAKDYVLKSRLQQRLVPAVKRALAEVEEHKERKKAEKELRAASHYSRTLIEASLDPLVTISSEGKVMDVNKATEEITGVSREQIVGSDFSNYFTEPEKARAGYKKAFSEGSVKDYPLAIRHITGRVTEVLYNATTYKNERGEIQGVFAAARDVTELKKAEKMLREAHRTQEERVKIRTVELEAEMAARKKMQEELRKSESRESAHFIELRRQAEDRMKVNHAVSCPSDMGDTQKLLHELQIYKIELEILNEELRQSKNETDMLLAKYLDVYDFAPIGYFTLNADGIIKQVNLTGARLLGVERSLLTGQQFRFHISYEFYPSFNIFFKKTFEGETIETCELMLPRREGTPPRLVQVEARLSEDRKECNLVMIDITRRKSSEKQSAEHTC